MHERKKVELDDLDRRILNRVQVEVPLDARPFRVLAEELGSTEDEVIARVQRLWDAGVVRRLGPIIDYNSWGMSGVLVGAKVDEARLDEVAAVMAGFPEITHAYLRAYEWNLWFTVIAEDEQKRDAIIELVTRRAGLSDVTKLPKLKTFKLGVNFEA